jgi:Cdc6-like AAA superfamily ATPase
MSEPVDNEFPTIDDLYKRMDELTREIATMTRDEPRRHDIVSELQRLNFVAESMKRAKP